MKFDNLQPRIPALTFYAIILAMAPYAFASSINSLYPSNWPANPFHKGEVSVQKRLGTHNDVMTFAPRFIRPYIPDQHIEFYEAQPFLVVAARDQDGRMWSTLLANGNNTMTTSPDAKTLELNAQPVMGDALEGQLKPGSDIGLLGIEFATKRRNRVNGRLVSSSPGSSKLVFKVDQSFGNCPQYIKPRQWWIATNHSSTSDKEMQDGQSCAASNRSNQLSREQISKIQKAETIFVATGYRDESDPNR